MRDLVEVGPHLLGHIGGGWKEQPGLNRLVEVGDRRQGHLAWRGRLEVAVVPADIVGRGQVVQWKQQGQCETQRQSALTRLAHSGRTEHDRRGGAHTLDRPQRHHREADEEGSGDLHQHLGATLVSSGHAVQGERGHQPKPDQAENLTDHDPSLGRGGTVVPGRSSGAHDEPEEGRQPPQRTRLGDDILRSPAEAGQNNARPRPETYTRTLTLIGASGAGGCGSRATGSRS